MRLEFYNARNGEINDEILIEDRLVFAASRPATIHSTEIIKVQTDLVVKVPTGYVLNISTAPELYAKSAELVPSSLAISHLDNEKSLDFFIRNSGRNSINVLPKQVVAVGFVVAVEVPEIGELVRVTPIEVKLDLSPKKKAKVSSIKFELK
jgi:dUTPase